MRAGGDHRGRLFVGAGARLEPFALFGALLAAAVVVTVALVRGASRDTGATIACGALLLTIACWLGWLARPSFLPPGGGPDLAHHLLLVDYLERHWQLPGGGLADAMGEMAHYTPGLHLLAALAGAWTRSDGLHAVYPIMAITFALKCVVVFLIALRTIPDTPARIPLALAAVMLSLVPQVYVTGSFLHDSFLAQAAAELFAVAMWWAVVVWDAAPARTPMMLFAAAGVAAFLTWPMWVGAPIVTLVAMVITRAELPVARRLQDLAIGVAPVLAVAALHAAGRTGWMAVAGTSGGVMRPSVAAFGWIFVTVAAAGLVFGVFDRRARATVLLTVSLLVQSITLYALARAGGASTPYMAFKMFYLLVYPLAVLGALAIATPWRLTVARAFPRRAVREAVAWSLLVVAVYAYRKPLTARPQAPIISSDLDDAGRWARAQLESACVDYLVPHADTAYWLHLAVLGNPRSSLRTANPDTFEPARAIARWIEPGGLPYAVVDMRALPHEVLSDVDVLEEFGDAAVVKRRGPSFCPDAQRFALRPGDGTRDRLRLSAPHRVDRDRVVREDLWK